MKNGYTNDFIVRFIEAGEKLKKVVIWVSKKTLDRNEFRERLQDKWQVSDEFDGYHIIFTKIQ